MTAEQKKMIRDNAQATIDLAEARLRDDRVTDENVRHDLSEIAGLARALLEMVGPPASPWSPLSVKDTTAQDLLWEYAQRRRAVDGSSGRRTTIG